MAAQVKTVNVARDYSRFPAGRYTTDGPYSGERFRDEILVPALDGPTKVVVELDDTLGYGSSFLEEAFGGLVRNCSFSVADLRDRLSFKTFDDSLQREIWNYIETARKE